MEKVSIEYCHITPGVDFKQKIKAANIWMPKLVKMFDGDKVQKCIMIDDIHTTSHINKKLINLILKKLTIKPDTIYVESEFMREAHELIEKIDKNERDFIESGERIWLRENVEKYRLTSEFLLYWKKKHGQPEYSCPTLAATSYMYRLGLLKGDGVNVIHGDKIMKADRVVNLLSSVDVQVEDKAQSIIEATFKQALRKVSWFFY